MRFQTEHEPVTGQRSHELFALWIIDGIYPRHDDCISRLSDGYRTASTGVSR